MVEDADASRTTGSSPSPSVLTSSPWSRSLDWSSMGGSISTSSSSRRSCCSLPFPTIWEPQSWDKKRRKDCSNNKKTPLRHRVIHMAFYLPAKAAVNKFNPGYNHKHKLQGASAHQHGLYPPCSNKSTSSKQEFSSSRKSQEITFKLVFNHELQTLPLTEKLTDAHGTGYNNSQISTTKGQI